jgi:spore maturation protein CgeB
VLDDTAKKFSQSRILLNESVGHDMNMRTFEAMACRQVLLTEDVPPLHELFKDGEHLVTYRTIDEAVDLAKGLLADPERRKGIAESGYQEILAKHTYNHRVREILKTCIGWVPEEKVLARAL